MQERIANEIAAWMNRELAKFPEAVTHMIQERTMNIDGDGDMDGLLGIINKDWGEWRVAAHYDKFVLTHFSAVHYPNAEDNPSLAEIKNDADNEG